MQFHVAAKKYQIFIFSKEVKNTEQNYYLFMIYAVEIVKIGTEVSLSCLITFHCLTIMIT